MFHQTIQDILAIAGSGPRAEDILESLRSRILAFEPFDSGELLARSERGCERFVMDQGISDIGEKVFAELENEPTWRIDTAAEIQERGFEANPGLSSLLVLRLDVPPFDSAALVLGHRRAWSFAAAPLSRIRTLGNIALRLVAPFARPPQVPAGLSDLDTELRTLRSRVADLEAEIIGLRTTRTTRRSGRPR
jgi:hypothetical protein